MSSKLSGAVRIAAPFRNIAFDERAPRDRRRRPGRRASRSIAAPAELRGRDHAARRRAVSAVSTPAAVEEVLRGRARARALAACAPRRSTRRRTWCSSRTRASRRSSPRRAACGCATGARSRTTACCSRRAAARARSTCRARTCPACITCARSPTSTRITASLAPGARVLLVGAGYIGLEVAAVARQRGFDVTVLEAADRVMSRTVSVEVSAFYEACHRAAGVAIHCGAAVKALHGATRVTAVETTDGRTFACDVAIVGIGIVPNVELAARAGLECCERHRRRRVRANGRSAHRRRRRLHEPSAPAARAARAPRIRAERDSPGEGRGRDAARHADGRIPRCRGSGPISTT